MNLYERFRNSTEDTKFDVAIEALVRFKQTNPISESQFHELMIRAARNVIKLPESGKYVLNGDDCLKRADEFFRLVDTGDVHV